MRKPTAAGLLAATLFALAALAGGCASYQTPGAGVNLGSLSRADDDIAAVMKRQPAAAFPARVALARVQSSGYTSQSHASVCYGQGAYCVITTRDVETEDDIDRLKRLPMIGGVAVMNRLLLPERLASIKDLRLAAATLQADLLLVYSLDTRFNVDSIDIGPLALVSLGFFPNKQARVSTTASAALFDVRTGFLYGVAENTASEQQRATLWSTEAAIESARQQTEAASFHGMLREFETLWKGVVEANTRQR